MLLSVHRTKSWSTTAPCVVKTSNSSSVRFKVVREASKSSAESSSKALRCRDNRLSGCAVAWRECLESLLVLSFSIITNKGSSGDIGKGREQVGGYMHGIERCNIANYNKMRIKCVCSVRKIEHNYTATKAAGIYTKAALNTSGYMRIA